MNIFKKKAEKSLKCLGFKQALGVGLYCCMVAVIFWRGNDWFGKMDKYWGPVIFLMLFVVSALVTGLMVFYKPFLLLVDNKRKQALELVMYTAGWLLIMVVGGLLVAAIW